MVIGKKSIRSPYFITLSFVLSAVLIELIIILILNNGHLVYTIDDAYIHLALSENIWNGHYGINTIEFSAPSSSILWPFILSPFSNVAYFPFLLNVLAALTTSFFIVKILYASWSIQDEQTERISLSATAVSILLATNIIGLIFSGMEHSLQVLFVILICYGLIEQVEKGKVRWWFLIAIIAAPLIRYECMAISVPVLIYLLKQKYFKQPLIGFTLLLILMGGFSMFLYSLGLDLLPTSVAAKSSVVESESILLSIISNLKDSFSNQRQGIIMSFGVLALFIFQLFSKDKKRKELAVTTAAAVFLHFMAGKYGSYFRYEIYIWSFLILMSFYIFAPTLNKTFNNFSIKRSLAVSASVCLTLCLSGLLYIYSLFTLPIASNNIYEQQFQMHRFAVDYYKKPVAVNDLGYVSYQNDNFVLDIAGLGSPKVHEMRKKAHNNNWIEELANDYDVELAMVYQNRFNQLPNHWIRIGNLQLGKHRVTPAHSEVAFFASNQEEIPDILDKLNLFIKTLPPGVSFIFEENLKL